MLCLHAVHVIKQQILFDQVLKLATKFWNVGRNVNMLLKNVKNAFEKSQ